MTIERIGAILRSNGRYSLVHRFVIPMPDVAVLAGLIHNPALTTACGLEYGGDEIYDDTPAQIWLAGRSVDGITDCAECFPGEGRGRVVIGESNPESNSTERDRTEPDATE